MNVRPRFKFQHAAGSYGAVFVIGLFAGLITRLTDLLPSDTIWGWGSIATLFGFWIVSATLLTYFSSSNRNAGLNVSLYLFSMSLSFYVLQYAFGLFSARFDNGGFKTNLFILYPPYPPSAGWFAMFYMRGIAANGIAACCTRFRQAGWPQKR
ncbi:hypothetical protein LI291_04165 [Intestinibacillus massiliensis]|nr:hypothetical protein [Intestinibacillus massiliensis]